VKGIAQPDMKGEDGKGLQGTPLSTMFSDVKYGRGAQDQGSRNALCGLPRLVYLWDPGGASPAVSWPQKFQNFTIFVISALLSNLSFSLHFTALPQHN
jgi:hypothetical protein